MMCSYIINRVTLVYRVLQNVCLNVVVLSRYLNWILAMNVIRMIKVFGWEHKMSTLIADKREVEMKYLQTFRMLELLNNNIKYDKSPLNTPKHFTDIMI